MEYVRIILKFAWVQKQPAPPMFKMVAVWKLRKSENLKNTQFENPELLKPKRILLKHNLKKKTTKHCVFTILSLVRVQHIRSLQVFLK